MYAIGIDIGGTNTRIALVDEDYKIIKRVQFKTDANSPIATIHKIKAELSKFDEPFCGIGLSCPGPLDLQKELVLNAPNLNGEWHYYPIAEAMEKVLNIPVYLENDANLACLGESVIGKGKEYRYVSYLTISTGLGAGYVMDKKIYQGAHGFAHEIANIPLWKNGPSHGNIYPGGIEAISSGSAIVERAKAKGLEIVHAGDVYQLSLQGNKDAITIMDDAKEYLANTIAILYAFMDPEIVILGGSVALKIPQFVEEVEERVKQRVYENMKPLIHVVKAGLDEDSGLLGAACLAFLKQA